LKLEIGKSPDFSTPTMGATVGYRAVCW